MRRSDQRRDAVFANYQRDVTGRPLEELLGEARPLTRELAEGVDLHREELDDTIAAHAKGWTVDRIAPLDLNVMRVALYELDFMETPAEVAIDEAVELAKEYCGADAPGFVNGILGAVVREREPAK
ncbi:MAG TPA: transcription antitermination factor NusB [Solirubrobacterales bacterium]|nr:transcription antitermination factor NusB [Solirubrobacterales bacterium]